MCYSVWFKFVLFLFFISSGFLFLYNGKYFFKLLNIFVLVFNDIYVFFLCCEVVEIKENVYMINIY